MAIKNTIRADQVRAGMLIVTKIPTSKVIEWSDGKVRRVYCDIYSNAGSCYCMIHGCKVSVEGFNLISEATR